MDLQLTGKRALITGGSRGIGKATARVLAQEGVDVALLARNREVAEAAAKELSAETGRKIVAVVADTTDDEQVRAAVADAARLLGGSIDILVNSAARAATGGAPKLGELTADYFHNEMDTKVMGYLRCAREVAPGMKAAGWGRIINISGLAARQTGSIVGSVRNIAVTALTKNLADELGPHGINVTVIHPSVTRTEKTAQTIAERAKVQGISEQEVEKQMASRNTIRHVVDAMEVAHIIGFLCSPKARAINGDTIVAGGGAPGSIYY